MVVVWYTFWLYFLEAPTSGAGFVRFRCFASSRSRVAPEDDRVRCCRMSAPC